ncbi:hypothetical protein FHS16_001104 [Paenibacillus endophyticus]|uniref:Uncharacterized protein n=1 Tax=Paenibacillus endophyticus TaxID=1294268 RepID=A0A7W5C4I2_9BACL|nr:hypothetical protein [Paenibacillus endophyticus]MBB3151070.1 hypothetical protein [Paenibacillus endophyticus]
MENQLVSLKLPADWIIKWNQFYEINTNEFIDESFPFQIELQEDIFLFINLSRNRMLDLGWYPEGNPKGKYRLVLIEMDVEQDKEIENWNNPLITFTARDNIEIKNKVNEILNKVSEGLL